MIATVFNHCSKIISAFSSATIFLIVCSTQLLKFQRNISSFRRFVTHASICSDHVCCYYSKMSATVINSIRANITDPFAHISSSDGLLALEAFSMGCKFVEFLERYPREEMISKDWHTVERRELLKTPQCAWTWLLFETPHYGADYTDLC